MTHPEALPLADDGGGFPNSPLPLLVYRGVLPADAAVQEAAFARHGWSNAWRDGIFGYHHFHSIAHEVLGLAAGEVSVEFGGPAGRVLTLRAGDVAVIPAGVTHRNAGQSPNLLVVGAYPAGGDYDLRRGDPRERDAVLRAIAAVPRPEQDPVLGPEAGLCRLWAA
ncbi:cupin [Teichococcus vastitatis]|uniref:Cupin n=1 Tax=Teichococcus vastitatis TaxID=2307076 RepID=A0ABS9W9X9_9PROT|nr:cupin [Pseudoroseomonas vastitatis]MCI0756108.1 cupin [Pseudoroseomonas vastitatis]